MKKINSIINFIGGLASILGLVKSIINCNFKTLMKAIFSDHIGITFLVLGFSILFLNFLYSIYRKVIENEKSTIKLNEEIENKTQKISDRLKTIEHSFNQSIDNLIIQKNQLQNSVYDIKKQLQNDKDNLDKIL